MTVYLVLVVGGAVAEYFLRPIGRVVDLAKALWAKVRGAV